MMNKTIYLLKEFHAKPYGRYRSDCGENNTSGEAFREEHLVPALKQYETVTIELSGYNRYMRGFLNEISEGLIHDEGMSAEEVLKRVVFKHDDVPSIVNICNENISKHLK